MSLDSGKANEETRKKSHQKVRFLKLIRGSLLWAVRRREEAENKQSLTISNSLAQRHESLLCLGPSKSRWCCRHDQQRQTPERGSSRHWQRPGKAGLVQRPSSRRRPQCQGLHLLSCMLGSHAQRPAPIGARPATGCGPHLSRGDDQTRRGSSRWTSRQAGRQAGWLAGPRSTGVSRWSAAQVGLPFGGAPTLLSVYFIGAE